MTKAAELAVSFFVYWRPRRTFGWAEAQKMSKLSIMVRADCDAEAEVSVATSDDVPGLIAEAATPAELYKRLDVLIPELLELNACAPATGDRERATMKSGIAPTPSGISLSITRYCPVTQPTP
jgi:hypothetical protein